MQSPMNAAHDRSRGRFQRWQFLALGVLALVAALLVASIHDPQPVAANSVSHASAEAGPFDVRVLFRESPYATKGTDSYRVYAAKANAGYPSWFKSITHTGQTEAVRLNPGGPLAYVFPKLHTARFGSLDGNTEYKFRIVPVDGSTVLWSSAVEVRATTGGQTLWDQWVVEIEKIEKELCQGSRWTHCRIGGTIVTPPAGAASVVSYFLLGDDLDKYRGVLEVRYGYAREQTMCMNAAGSYGQGATKVEIPGDDTTVRTFTYTVTEGSNIGDAENVNVGDTWTTNISVNPYDLSPTANPALKTSSWEQYIRGTVSVWPSDSNDKTYLDGRQFFNGPCKDAPPSNRTTVPALDKTLKPPAGFYAAFTTKRQGLKPADDKSVLGNSGIPGELTPVFGQSGPATLSLPENSPAGTKLGRMATTLGIEVEGAGLAFFLEGADAAAFAIDDVGRVTTAPGANFDFETKPTYRFTANFASDSSKETILGSVSVTVNLTDVNDPPEFDEGESTTRSVAENSPAGTNVGLPVTATDPDDDKLMYIGLDGVDGEAFDLDPDTGQLTTKSGADYDYDTKSSYTFAVVVMELETTDPFLAGIDVTVNLTKAKETDNANGEGSDQGQQQQQQANRAPDFDSGIVTTLAVDENSGGGVNVGSPITATDPDEGDTLTYSLSGTDAASFAIGGSTGQIATVADVTYDYETDSSYSLAVEASDGKLSVSTPVTINLNDVNEAPAFAADLDTTLSVNENSAAGTNVGAPITATDPDSGDTLTYSLSGDDATSFEIGGSTGQITTKTGETYDYETDSSYSLTVNATDGDLSVSIAVTVDLNDVNEAPAFAASSATRAVAENSAAGTNVGAVITATDPDADDSITYSLSGTDASSFTIGGSTGQIATKSGETYNFEVKPSYSLTVEATDDDGLSDSIDITVNLTDVDEAPTVSDKSQFKNHAATVGQPFSLTLPAADANSGDGGYEYLLWHRGHGKNFMDQAINGLRFNATTRTLSGTPEASGVWQLSYVVHDDDANRSVADRFRARTKLQITVSE